MEVFFVSGQTNNSIQSYSDCLPKWRRKLRRNTAPAHVLVLTLISLVWMSLCLCLCRTCDPALTNRHLRAYTHTMCVCVCVCVWGVFVYTHHIINLYVYGPILFFEQYNKPQLTTPTHSGTHIHKTQFYKYLTEHPGELPGYIVISRTKIESSFVTWHVCLLIFHCLSSVQYKKEVSLSRQQQGHTSRVSQCHFFGVRGINVE